MSSTVANILNKFLGSWIENLNSEQLNLSLFSGTVELENLKLKADIFQVLGLPIRLVQGSVGQIKVKIPWSSFYSSPLIIEVTNISMHLTPITPEHWTAKDAKELFLVNKRALLENFDMMTSDDMDLPADSSFFNSFVSKIIDNLCVKISNVYIRYEDTTSCNEPFAIGMILKEANLFTTNELWEAEYRANANDSYKLLLVEHLSVFFDYEDGILLHQQWYDGDEGLEILASEELEEKIYHKFLLSPFSARVEAVHMKTTSLITIPRFSFKIFTIEVKLQLFIAHLRFLAKLNSFLNTYSNFTKGIEKDLIFKNFTQEAEVFYQAKYRKLRKRMKSGKYPEKLEKLKKTVERLEEGISVVDIKNQRKVVVMDLRLDSMKNTKEKELETFSRNRNRKLSTKVIDFFGRKSQADIAHEDDMRAKRQSIVSNDLQRVLLRSNSIMKQVAYSLVTDRDHPEKVKFSVIFQVEKLSFSLLEEEHCEFIQMLIQGISLQTSVRAQSQKLKFSIDKCVVLNTLGQSHIFPRFLESERLLVEYDSLNNKYLKMQAGEIGIYADFNSAIKILQSINQTMNKDIDCARYLDEISGTTEKYISQGSNYLKEVIETGVGTRYELEIDLKAPTVVLILDIAFTNSPVLVLDFGRLTARTSSSSLGSSEYHTYIFELHNLRVFSENVEQEFVDILVPVNITFNIFTSKNREENDPGLCIRINIGRTQLNLSDSVIFLMIQFFKKHNEVSKILQESLGVEQERKYTERKIEAIPALYQVEIDEFVFTLIQQDFPIAQLEIHNIRVKFSSNTALNFKGKLLIGKVSLIDVSGAEYKEIISVNNNEVDEEVFEDAKEALYQVKSSFLTKTKDNIVDISVKLADFTVVGDLKFIEALQGFNEKCQKNFRENIQSESKTSTQTLGKYSQVLRTNLRYSVEFNNLHLMLPFPQEKSWHSALIKLNLIMIYVVESKFEKKFNAFQMEIWRRLMETKTEASVMLNHMSLHLKKKQFVKCIIDSSRVSVDYSSLVVAGQTPETSIQTRMESLSVTLGFRDLEYLNKLKNAWYGLIFPATGAKVSDYSSTQVTDFDSLQITLQNDIESQPHSIAYLQFSNFLHSKTYNSGSTKSFFSAVFYMNYYNIPHGEWEPLIEDWKFTVTGLQHSPDSAYEMQIDSKEHLNINISKTTCETLGIIYKRYYETAADWEDFESYESLNEKTLDYELINQLGITVDLWFVNKARDLKQLKHNERVKMKYFEIRHLFARIKPKNKFEVGKSIVPVVNVTPMGFSTARELVIEDSYCQKFLISNDDEVIKCRKDIEIKNSRRVINFCRDCVVVNSCQRTVVIKHRDDTVEVSEKFFVPVNWSLNMMRIVTFEGDFELSSEFCVELEKDVFVAIDFVDSEETTEFSQQITIKAPYSFQNLLPCPVNLVCSSKRVTCIFSGSSFNFTQNTSNEIFCSLELLLGSTVLSTEPFLLTESTTIINILGQQDWQIISSIKPNKKCMSVTIFSKFLIVNSSEFTISLNKCILPCKSLGFYSKNKEAFKVKTLDDSESSFSSKFNSKAIGVSSCITIPLKDSFHKSYCLGIRVSQAPSPLLHSKFIKITPRFIMVNYLDFPLYIKQAEKQNPQIVMINPGRNIHYQLDDSSISSNIQVSEDSLQWSGIFSLNSLEDFQTRFKGYLREVPKRKNIFAKDKFWYLACPKTHMYFYIRVNITSEDDACIKIEFSLPSDPIFIICNSSSEDITVKQTKSKSVPIQVPAGMSTPWAFDNHILTNKKVTITAGDFKQKYSLEKIKEKNKDLGPHSVSVKFEGETRVLTVYDVEETQPALKINFLNSVNVINTSKINFQLASVNFSMLDNSNNEVFLIHIRELSLKHLRVDERRNKFTKLRSKFDFIMGGLQVDNMSKNKNIFHVVAYQTGTPDPRTPFFQFRLDREFTRGGSTFVTSIDRILEFELQMQPLSMNLNFDFILAASYLQQVYFKSFYQLKDFERPIGLFTVEELYPELDPVIHIPESVIYPVRCYFKYLRVRGSRFNLTFANTDSSSSSTYSQALSSSAPSFFLDLASFENSRLTFTEIILQYSFQNLQSLIWALLKNYTRQGLLQFYRVLGSSEILGNPIGLIDKLGTGVYEFFNEPAKGLLLGPKGFINGVGKGVKSLVSNVIAGSFQSVANITGSLYKIVSYENLPNTNLYNTLGIMDIASGVSGIVMKPYKGFKKSGAKGLVIGMGSGVLGAVVAPVAAMLHFSSTVSSRVAKTAELLVTNKTGAGRIRFPRYLNSRKVLEPYHNALSKIWYFIAQKEFNESEVRELVELEKESIVITNKSLFVIVQEEIVKEVELSAFDNKEVHFYKKTFVFRLSGERSFSVTSRLCAPVLKMYMAVEL